MLRIALACRSLLIAAAAFAVGPAMAETSAPIAGPSVAGVYDAGEMEIAARLLLGPDGTFQYDMSYGAVDETASGTWTETSEGIVLNSDPVSAPAFVLVDRKNRHGGTSSLILDVPKGLPIQLFSAIIFFSDGSASREDFRDAHLDLRSTSGKLVTAVALMFPAYMIASDKFAVPAKGATMHFRFEPNDLGKVAFDHKLLVRNGNDFLLPRYDRELRFRKQQADY